jgi:hypothetical protein
MSYTQEELTSIWQELMDDPGRDEFQELDVSGIVQSFSIDKLKASVLTNTDTEQAILMFIAGVLGEGLTNPQLFTVENPIIIHSPKVTVSRRK